MKHKQVTQIYDKVKKLCGEIPHKEINFGNQVTIKQYCTLRAGAMGFQVHTIMHDYRSKHIKVLHGKTCGTGYCKESESYDSAISAMGIRTKEDTSKGPSEISHKYHVGGNYYFVPKSEIRKYK
jgi:hypothetical protein